MSKVVMFLRDEMFSGEKERNEEFRKKVNELANLMLEDGYTCAEYNVNTPAGFEKAFEDNPDCKVVFTTENNSEAQYQACKREIPVIEWRCFSDNKVSLVRVNKDTKDNITSYEVHHTK